VIVAHVTDHVSHQREADLYQPLLYLFRHYPRVFAEVPFFRKHIDLVFATSNLLRLYAVETKLRRWRSALKQAALNQLAAQYSYVALPARLAERLAECESTLFASYGVGLVAVSKTARILIPAARNGYFSARHYRALKDTLTRASRTQNPQKMGVLADALTKRSRSVVFLQARAQ